MACRLVLLGFCVGVAFACLIRLRFSTLGPMWPSFTGFYLVLLGFTSLHLVLLDFLPVLGGCTRFVFKNSMFFLFCRVFLNCTVVLPSFT